MKYNNVKHITIMLNTVCFCLIEIFFVKIFYGFINTFVNQRVLLNKSQVLKGFDCTELCLKHFNQNWRYPCAQVIFDSDPAPMGRPVPAQIEEMSQAMIRYLYRKYFNYKIYDINVCVIT